MTRGERVIAFIEEYCRVPEGKLVGQKIQLDPFQKKFILEVYDNPAGTTEGYLSIARKNGKTALIAGIVLAHVAGPEARLNSQIVSGAMSREQAAIVFSLACKMIQFEPRLQSLIHITPSGKRLIGLAMNVEYKALAAEGKTTHGLSPVLAIIDELGQVKGPQDDFIDAITTAQGAHEDPLLLVISTQAATDADLLSIWIDDARNSNDPHIVCHIYEAPADCDLDDREAWAAANPALGKFRSLPDMERLATKAMRMPSSEPTFRNLNLNQRVTTFSPFVSRGVWEGCGEAPVFVEGAPIYGGLDLSSRIDLTSLVLVQRDDDAGRLLVYPYFWTPEQGLAERAKRDRQPYDVWARQGYLRTTPGATVDYEAVARDIGDILSELGEVDGLSFDRWRIDVFKKELERIGLELPLTPFGQGFKDMSPAIDILEAELMNGRVQHGMHPVLTMCAANSVVIKDAAGNRKLDKAKSTGRIDGMVALVMAMGAMGSELEGKKEYEMFFL